MSRDLGRDVPDLEKLYARKLWADFSYPKSVEPWQLCEAYLSYLRNAAACAAGSNMPSCLLGKNKHDRSRGSAERIQGELSILVSQA